MSKNTKEMYEGREVELVKLPDSGDTVLFITELRGKEYRMLKKVSVSMVKMKVNTDKVNTEKSGSMEMDLGNFYEEITMCFPYLALAIRKADGAVIGPNMEYFDNSSYQDADVIFNHIQQLTSITQPSAGDPEKKSASKK